MSIFIPEKNILFQHVYKCGGQSLTEMFYNIFENENVIGGKYSLLNKIANRYFTRGEDYTTYDGVNKQDRFRRLDRRMWGHPTMSQLEHCFGQDELDKMLTITVVRHPVEWQISQYFYARSNRFHFQYKLFNSMSFEEFCIYRRDVFFEDLTSILCRADGSIRYSLIGKVEEFSKFINDLKTLIGCDRIELPYKNRTHRSPIELKKTSLAILNNLHARDYERLDYKKY